MTDLEVVFLAFAAIAVWVLTIAVIVVIVAGGSGPTRASAYPLIVLYAVLLHYFWAGALLIDPRAGEATPLSALDSFVGMETAPFVLLVVATLALAYVVLFSSHRLWAVVLALPQQAVLLLSAGTALQAMVAGTYADGIERPIAFIAADRAPAVIAALLHTAALVAGFWRPKVV